MARRRRKSHLIAVAEIADVVRDRFKDEHLVLEGICALASYAATAALYLLMKASEFCMPVMRGIEHFS